MSNLNKSKYTAEDEYPDLENHKNHMAHVLTLEMYKHLRAKQTASGFTIDHVIQSGVDNLGHPYNMADGCVAGDEDSYEVFAEFFDPVIEARHNGYKPTDKSKSDLNASKIRGGNFDEKYVQSVRVRANRSIRGFALSSWNSRAERRKVSNIAQEALNNFSGNFQGKYYALNSVSENELEKLVADSIAFDKPSCPFANSSGLTRDWPDNRGFFHNNSKNFIAWVNNLDHVQLISLQKGGNLKEAFSRFTEGLNEFAQNIEQNGNEFQQNSHLGYISASPSNIGTGLRASVHAKLPKLAEHNRFDEALTKLRLSQSAAGEGSVDISNADRIGFSEVQLVQFVIDGVNFLVNCEKMLEAGENINAEVDKLTQK